MEQGKRRRAAKACEFCRKRKMKCDDEKPRCTNCKLYGKECQYASKPRKVRASKESSKLSKTQPVQTPSSNDSPEPSGDTTSKSKEKHPAVSIDNTYRDSSVPIEQREDSDEDLLHQRVSAAPLATPSSNVTGQQPSYYGRTSALFDEESSDNKALWVKRQAVENTRRQLLGEAAYQKQLETMNYRAGKLDFDGIEPEVGMHLLSLHWNRQHHSHLITYRPAFMRDMACQGPYFSKLLLNAIYYGSCKFSPRPELKGFHTRFRERVRELLGQALDKSAITTIQAMLIMTNSLFALGDERSAAWTYAGIAFRMLIDLGAHLDGSNSRLSDEELEIRRRVFWGAFVVDKIQSLYQGRPVSIRHTDTKVPILFMDQFEELETWHPFAYPNTASYPGSPAYSVSTFTELCKLSVIMSSILDNVYGVQSSKQKPEALVQRLEEMQHELEAWKKALPSHLNYEPSSKQIAPPPHVLSLLAMFNVLLILLHRPFVSEGHLHSTSTSIATSSFAVCAQAATRTVLLLRVYEKTFSIRHAPYLIAYATYVAATIHVRIAAQLGPGSDAYGMLRTCCSVFAKNQKTNWAARRAQAVIINLMKKLDIELTIHDEPTPDTRAHDPTNEFQEHIQTGPGKEYSVYPSSAGIVTPDENGTVPHGSVSDLDMNLIIHSFVNEQQNHQPDPFAQDIQYPQNFPAGFFPNMSQMPNADMYGSWGAYEMPADEEYGDALFGFNGAALDGMWQ